MWKMTLAMLSGVLILGSTAAAKPHKVHEVESAVGGFIAGVVASEIFDGDVSVHYTKGSCGVPNVNNRYQHHYEKENKRYWNRHRGWERDHYQDRDYHHARKGHWEYRKQRVWIPGHWEWVVGRCGQERRVWVDGYYRFKKVKVWVPNYREDWRRRY
jgi:hypothetical protein